jgi:Rod binding domain-containing protein
MSGVEKMSVSLPSSWSGMATAPTPEAKAVSKSEKAGRDFEALLLTPVLESLQKTFSGPEADAASVGADDYRHMSTQALAQAIAERGGIGIAKLLRQHLAAEVEPGASASTKVSDGR